jgi:uncharacterized protein
MGKSMNKIRLNILGLSYSQTQTGAYALVLAEENGRRRIPIIIGGTEAQSIAIQLEGLTPLRPLTHDLFVSMAKSFHINMIEANIFKLEEGIFYSEMVCECEGKVIKIDARTSDAVAIALRFNCPIFATEKILAKAGIILDEEGEEKPVSKVTEEEAEDGKKYTKYTIEELQQMLEDAVRDENYETASEIRDEINQRKNT